MAVCFDDIIFSTLFPDIWRIILSICLILFCKIIYFTYSNNKIPINLVHVK